MGFGALLKNLTTGTTKKEREEMKRLLSRSDEIENFMQSDSKKHPDAQPYTSPPPSPRGAVKKKDTVSTIKRRNKALQQFLDK